MKQKLIVTGSIYAATVVFFVLTFFNQSIQNNVTIAPFWEFIVVVLPVLLGLFGPAVLAAYEPGYKQGLQQAAIYLAVFVVLNAIVLYTTLIEKSVFALVMIPNIVTALIVTFLVPVPALVYRKFKQ